MAGERGSHHPFGGQQYALIECFLCHALDLPLS
jgi:hypothetical protein